MVTTGCLIFCAYEYVTEKKIIFNKAQHLTGNIYVTTTRFKGNMNTHRHTHRARERSVKGEEGCKKLITAITIRDKLISITSLNMCS